MIVSERLHTMANDGSRRYDLCRGGKAEHAKVLETIPQVPLPDSAPLHGTDGPLTTLWRLSMVAL